MEKRNMYPEMPPLPGGLPDAPPSYDQSMPTAPMMTSSSTTGSGPMTMQPQSMPMHQQQQQFIPQQVLVQGVQPIPPLGPRPCMVTCPSCRQQQMSNVRPEASTKTHLYALVLCVVGLCCCACVPYCVDSCKNANHYCGNCDAYLGTYSK